MSASRLTHLIIGVVLLITLSACQPNATTIEPTAISTPTAQPANTLAPTDTPAPAKTPEPTAVKERTSTPEATATPKPPEIRVVPGSEIIFNDDYLLNHTLKDDPSVQSCKAKFTTEIEASALKGIREDGRYWAVGVPADLVALRQVKIGDQTKYEMVYYMPCVKKWFRLYIGPGYLLNKTVNHMRDDAEIQQALEFLRGNRQNYPGYVRLAGRGGYDKTGLVETARKLLDDPAFGKPPRDYDKGLWEVPELIPEDGTQFYVVF
jgi:hypothetical protein